MTPKTLDFLYSLLGRAVLLPVPEGVKGCQMRGWTQTTWENTQSPAYKKQLLLHGNTGVLLGKASGNLISVDCDSDTGLDEFLALNPALRASLITRGARGGNIWLRMPGDYPLRTRRLGKNGGWGEFRSNGSQTVIHGRHPEGHPYQILHEGQPLIIAYSSICWPASAAAGRAKESACGEEREGDSSSSLHATPPSPLHASPPSPLHDIPSPEAIAVLEAFEQQQPHLSRLYDRLIVPLLPLAEGSRNLILTTEITPRLYGAMNVDAAAVVIRVLIEADKLGGYPSAEALEKSTSAWQGLEAAWIENLSPQERRILEALREPRSRDAFRICRQLALCDSDPEFPPPTFYLSCETLAARLHLMLPNGRPDSQTAWRLLRKLQKKYGIVHSIHPGKAHGHGERGKTAVFAWAFPVGQTPAAPPP